MLKIENTEVLGWEHAIRGMRNPMNSHNKSDSRECIVGSCDICDHFTICNMKAAREPYFKRFWEGGPVDCDFAIGPSDHALMMKLRNAGTDHRKFMRMIAVYVDITAPLYWWKEFDTYKVGTVANSCSTMHKIHEKEFTLDDFSCEHLMIRQSVDLLNETIDLLNHYRNVYLNGGLIHADYAVLKELSLKGAAELDYGEIRIIEPSDKDIWWQMIQLLPSSYNQKRTVMLNYEVLANIYKSRKDHKLDEWVEFCKFIETLPYSELITGKENN